MGKQRQQRTVRGKSSFSGIGGRDGYVHTAVFKTNDQQGPAVQHRELCSNAAGMGAESNGEQMLVHAWLSPFAVHLKLTALSVRYTSVQK